MPTPDRSDELVETLDIAFAGRGNRRGSEVAVAVVRELNEDDLPLLAAPPRVGWNQKIGKIRASHHALARALALGASGEDAALMTGYSSTYISAIAEHDPSFRALVEYYSQERQAVFVDTMERMKALGVDALEELQERLANDPEGWTKRELMDMAKMMLGEPGAGRNGANGAAAAAVAVNVRFVSSESADVPSRGVVIDAVEVQGEE